MDRIADILKQHREEYAMLSSRRTAVRAKLGEGVKQLSNSLIKVITGPRRAGKSIFALQLLSDLKIAYINFDDDALLTVLAQNKSVDIIAELKNIYGDFEFCLLDEVQNFVGWELLVNKLQRRGINLVITGSNAKLLSQELSTHLTGRYVEIEILPFSWQEYSSALQGKASLDSYLLSGGFPEVVLTSVDARTYIENLAHAIILKDVVNRKRIRHPQMLLRLFEQLRTQFATQQSISKITAGLQFSSKTTTEKYISYLIESFLVVGVERFSSKFREQIRSPRKYYPIDLGICLNQPIFPDNTARRLETLVFLELRKGLAPQRSTIYSYHTKSGWEVDFVVKIGDQFSELIQVSYAVNDPATIERETRSLFQAAEELQCKELKIITMSDGFDFVDKNRKLNIQAIPIMDWICEHRV